MVFDVQNKKRWMRRRKARRKHWLNKYKLAKSCELCGYNKSPYALHFDHLNSSTKVKAVSRMIMGSLKTLMLELRKCRVLCANCHFVISAEEELRKAGHERIDF